MRVVFPISSFSKRFPVFKYITELSRNFHLEKIKELIDKIYCLLTCHGETVGVEINVDEDEAVLRQPDPLARKTIVSNTGEVNLFIYEEHQMVLIISPGDTETLPLSGRLLITARTETGEGSVFITTHRRCLCGDPEPPPYAGSEPIGGPLI